MRRWLALALFLLSGVAVQAATCETTEYDGAPFTWCRVDVTQDALRLWLYDEAGTPYGTFSNLADALQSQGDRLGLAMNAGMFHPDRSAVGLYVEDGKELAKLVTKGGPGNFGLLPNGVFCIGDGWARVVESRAFAADPLPCRHATQSGPMLLIGGALHPKFLPKSDSLNIRNGVGVLPDEQTVILAISDAPVNFHHFARFFRDVAGTPDALYLDGSISQIYAPDIGRSSHGIGIGPILGIVRPAG